MVSAREFCLAWNLTHNELVLATTDILSVSRYGGIPAPNLRILSSCRMYASMRYAWNRLYEALATSVCTEKERMALFLRVRAKIFNYSRPIVVWGALRHSWGWSHVFSEYTGKEEVRATILSDELGHNLHTRTRTYVIICELLTVCEMPERHVLEGVDHQNENEVFDQISSEVEWRRGLHSDRRNLVLTKGIN